MPMRAWPLILFTACGAALAVACITQEDPNYGTPGAIGKFNFPGATSSGSTSSGDGGSSGTPGGPFPAPYDEANPPAPPQPLGPLHPTVANGAQVSPEIACGACHGPAGIATKKWAFAGHAASAPGAQTGLDKGEVIVFEGATKLGPVKTSPDGYFWIEAEAGTIPQKAQTAIRDRTGKVSQMVQNLVGNGDCNTATQCHGVNGTGGRVDFK